MRCPSCKEFGQDKVIDSRPTESGKAIRRRRECLACGRRYTTKERVEDEPSLIVVKKDGSRMPFDMERLIRGIEHACYKRPISQEIIQKLAESVEEELIREFERETPSQAIGAKVARKLRNIDQVAYVRYASVYREFRDLNDLIDEIEYVKDSASEHIAGQQELFD